VKLEPNPRERLQVSPATVHLDERHIRWAIDEYVQKSGYKVGKVTLSATPHQTNGPDSFSAVVEVSFDDKGATQ
jgi:hypothetical protein